MAMVLGVLILLTSMIPVELGVTVAIVEIVLGVFAGNVLGASVVPIHDQQAHHGPPPS